MHEARFSVVRHEEVSDYGACPGRLLLSYIFRSAKCLDTLNKELLLLSQMNTQQKNKCYMQRPQSIVDKQRWSTRLLRKFVDISAACYLNIHHEGKV